MSFQPHEQFGQYWECSVCTLRNASETNVCDACGQVRSFSHRFKQPLRDDRETWACSACTFENVGIHSVCHMCNTQRKREPQPNPRTVENDQGTDGNGDTRAQQNLNLDNEQWHCCENCGAKLESREELAVHVVADSCPTLIKPVSIPDIIPQVRTPHVDSDDESDCMDYQPQDPILKHGEAEVPEAKQEHEDEGKDSGDEDMPGLLIESRRCQCNYTNCTGEVFCRNCSAPLPEDSSPDDDTQSQRQDSDQRAKEDEKLLDKARQSLKILCLNKKYDSVEDLVDCLKLFLLLPSLEASEALYILVQQELKMPVNEAFYKLKGDDNSDARNHMPKVDVSVKEEEEAKLDPAQEEWLEAFSALMDDEAWTCIKCGQKLPINMKDCLRCKTPRSRPKMTIPPLDIGDSAGSDDKGFWFCRPCKQYNSVDITECYNCHALNPNASYCIICYDNGIDAIYQPCTCSRCCASCATRYDKGYCMNCKRPGCWADTDGLLIRQNGLQDRFPTHITTASDALQYLKDGPQTSSQVTDDLTSSSNGAWQMRPSSSYNTFDTEDSEKFDIDDAPELKNHEDITTSNSSKIQFSALTELKPLPQKSGFDDHLNLDASEPSDVGNASHLTALPPKQLEPQNGILSDSRKSVDDPTQLEKCLCDLEEQLSETFHAEEYVAAAELQPKINAIRTKLEKLKSNGSKIELTMPLTSVEKSEKSGACEV